VAEIGATCRGVPVEDALPALDECAQVVDAREDGALAVREAVGYPARTVDGHVGVVLAVPPPHLGVDG